MSWHSRAHAGTPLLRHHRVFTGLSAGGQRPDLQRASFHPERAVKAIAAAAPRDLAALEHQRQPGAGLRADHRLSPVVVAVTSHRTPSSRGGAARSNCNASPPPVGVRVSVSPARATPKAPDKAFRKWLSTDIAGSGQAIIVPPAGRGRASRLPGRTTHELIAAGKAVHAAAFEGHRHRVPFLAGGQRPARQPGETPGRILQGGGGNRHVRYPTATRVVASVRQRDVDRSRDARCPTSRRCTRPREATPPVPRHGTGCPPSPHRLVGGGAACFRRRVLDGRRVGGGEARLAASVRSRRQEGSLPKQISDGSAAQDAVIGARQQTNARARKDLLIASPLLLFASDQLS